MLADSVWGNCTLYTNLILFQSMYTQSKLCTITWHIIHAHRAEEGSTTFEVGYNLQNEASALN